MFVLPIDKKANVTPNTIFETIFWYHIDTARYLLLFYQISVFCRLDSTDNLFNYMDDGNRVEPSVSFCSCVVNSFGTSNATCNYKISPRSYFDNTETWVELVHPNAHVRDKAGSNPVIVLPPIEDDVIYKFEPQNTTEIVPGWPTPSGRTKLEVEAYCNDKIRNSTSGKICAVIPRLTFDQYVQQCITDIQVVRLHFNSDMTYTSRVIYPLRQVKLPNAISSIDE